MAIDVPGLVTSVAFGMQDPHALYITTGIDPGGRGGCLFVTHVHAPGRPNPWRGSETASPRNDSPRAIT